MESLDYRDLLKEAIGFIGGTATSRGKPHPISAYEGMTLSDLRTSKSSGRGARLVKFFPDTKGAGNRNYSEEALRNQTVFISDPRTFNDPFDCVIGYNQVKTMHWLLSELADEFGVEIGEHKDLAERECEFAEGLTSLDGRELPRLRRLADGASTMWHHVGYYNILFDALRRGLSAVDGDAVHAALLQFIRGVESITAGYGVSCFTDGVGNGYMWAHYAAGYRGFAIEYENDADSLEALGFLSELSELLESNIWDVFYLLERPDCTDMVEQYITCSTDSEWATRLYVRGLCTKHVSWGMENESRLILPVTNPLVVSCKRNIPFYPARNVYLGVGMPAERKEEIVSICAGLNNPPKVYDMTTDTSSFIPHFEEVSR